MRCAVDARRTRCCGFARQTERAFCDSRSIRIPRGEFGYGGCVRQPGSIVGLAFTNYFLVSHAFLWNPTTVMQPLADLRGNASLAQAINADGTAVGWSYDAGGVRHTVKWDASGSLTDLNPSG